MAWRDELAAQDPLLLEVIDEELAAYEGVLSPEALEHFREEALALLATHPYPRALLDALRARPAVSASTDVDKHAGEALLAAAKRGRQG